MEIFIFENFENNKLKAAYSIKTFNDLLGFKKF